MQGISATSMWSRILKAEKGKRQGAYHETEDRARLHSAYVNLISFALKQIIKEQSF